MSDLEFIGKMKPQPFISLAKEERLRIEEIMKRLLNEMSGVRTLAECEKNLPMSEMFKKAIKSQKKTLDELLSNKLIVTGREVIRQIEEKERHQREFEESIEFEAKNKRIRK